MYPKAWMWVNVRVWGGLAVMAVLFWLQHADPARQGLWVAASGLFAVAFLAFGLYPAARFAELIHGAEGRTKLGFRIKELAEYDGKPPKF